MSPLASPDSFVSSQRLLTALSPLRVSYRLRLRSESPDGCVSSQLCLRSAAAWTRSMLAGLVQGAVDTAGQRIILAASASASAGQFELRPESRPESRPDPRPESAAVQNQCFRS